MPNVKKMRKGRKRWSKEKFDRCVSKVKGVKNAYAVCMASMQGTTKRKKRRKVKRR